MHIIDCNADPFVPEGYQVVRHDRRGQIDWGPTQDQERYGRRLLLPPMWNANVLDFLLAHPHLIPATWGKRTLLQPFGRNIMFAGTLYKSPSGHDATRYLYKKGDEWAWECDWPDY